jgi:hypothetical protein
MLRSTVMMEEYVLTLADIDPDQRAMVGCRAANQALLKQAGFPVPAGLCLTMAAQATGHRRPPGKHAGRSLVSYFGGWLGAKPGRGLQDQPGCAR